MHCEAHPDVMGLPIFTDAAVYAKNLLRTAPSLSTKHINPFRMGNETPCCNLIHLSNSFPFFRDFIFPRIDCTSVATRIKAPVAWPVRQHARIVRPAHPLHTMDGS
jgi:hypothetical protein